MPWTITDCQHTYCRCGCKGTCPRPNVPVKNVIEDAEKLVKQASELYGKVKEKVEKAKVYEKLVEAGDA